ncbi:hypothetical protein [Corynebacterium sp.]|uniref:hypothetical protein n=1 Tax=Corynebacterium sp. TaxID=1720 RepID=UPI0026DB55CC|nr:hypothetical protein [Corynebacterium sp.]MDO5076685.1 hypothetical protein [Corynebacterium sp.]MDO5076689.1 hypothetical protein [Corynebacterium sp.]
MYGFIWRAIPGPWPVKLLVSLALLVGTFFLLMEVVFPFVSANMPYNDVSV